MTLLQDRIIPGVTLEVVLSTFSGFDGFEPPGEAHDVRPPDTSFLPVGVFRGWPVVALETAPGRSFPDYPVRRALRAELPESLSDGIVIFTDAAHSEFVWSWRALHRTGHSRYIEYTGANRARQLRGALAGLPPPGAAVDSPEEVEPLVVDRLFQVIVRDGAPESGKGSDLLQAMLDRIERFDDPDEVRRVWRRLRGFSVLHDDCLDGGRLVRAGATLELVLTAVLERMRSFVDDAILRRDRRRPEHLRDLRALIETADGQALRHGRSPYLRRLIVQQNLFAAVTSRSAGRAVLRDLLGYAGPEDSGMPMIDCNIWRMRDSDGHVSRTFPRRPAEGDTGSSDRPEEELALHRKAWQMVRTVRIAGGEHRELRGAACQLHRRRQLLLGQLRQLADGEEPRTVADELVFCRPASGRGFSAVFRGVQT